MATRPKRRPRFEELGEAAPLVVRRGSLPGPNGRTYAAGEEFPYRDLPWRRARALYDQRYLVPPAERRTPSVAAAGVLRVRRRPGTGYYDVLGPDGSAVNEKALRRPAAEALAAA